MSIIKGNISKLSAAAAASSSPAKSSRRSNKPSEISKQLTVIYLSKIGDQPKSWYDQCGFVETDWLDNVTQYANEHDTDFTFRYADMIMAQIGEWERESSGEPTYARTLGRRYESKIMEMVTKMAIANRSRYEREIEGEYTSLMSVNPLRIDLWRSRRGPDPDDPDESKAPDLIMMPSCMPQVFYDALVLAANMSDFAKWGFTGGDRCIKLGVIMRQSGRPLDEVLSALPEDTARVARQRANELLKWARDFIADHGHRTFPDESNHIVTNRWPEHPVL